MESELSEFLSDELFSFIREDTSPISSHAHHASGSNYEPDELDLLLLRAIENFEDTAGQETVSTSRPFGKAISEENIEQAIQSAVPASTRKDTKYCVSIWDEWVVARANSTGTIIPYLKDITLPELNHWICYFILEVRKKDGTEFPPNTLHHICCGILRYLRISGVSVDIFKDKEFIKFRNVLDSEMKRLQALGLGTKKRKAEVITCEDEEAMWEKGILGDSNPQSLLNTMVYMNGLYFALRGGKEHRQLRHQPSQITLVEKPGEKPYLLYNEDVSKNHPGGLKDRKNKQKIVMHHANLENPKRCFVFLYKLYNSHCPSDRPSNSFYLQPLKHPSKELWYSTTPVGHTTLEKTVGRMCKSAGMVGYYTNHSLRATSTTRMYQHDVDEQQIMERTGHRSTEAVRSYKRTSTHQQEKVSSILNNEKRYCSAANNVQHNNMDASTGAQMHHHLSLECASNDSVPVFNISNCSSVSITFSK